MAYKLVVGNKVNVPVDFSLNDGDEVRQFSFTLHCDRLEATEIRKRTEKSKQLVSSFLTSVITGWKGQSLVIDAAGKPADFNRESLATMLNVAGLSTLIYARYLAECGAVEKN